MSYDEDEVSRAIKVIRQAMVDDGPVEPGSYAHSWYCNLAMCVYDSTPDEIDRGVAIELGNEAARRFMKLCFDVDTRA